MNLIIFNFIFFNLVVFILCFYVAFKYHNFKLKSTKQQTVTFIQFINNSKKMPSLNTIGVGLIFGVIFGFLDNFGLWMGIDKLNKFLPGGLLTKAALGNTYSDLLGAIVGTCISTMAKDKFNYDEDSEPIWANTVGILLGCFLGMFIGKLITGKN